jgi:hypothetical protein
MGIAATPKRLEILETAVSAEPRKTPAQASPQENPEVYPLEKPDSITLPPVPARKRGKAMSRRKGQNPKVRIGKRANGEKYFFFQYWIDVPGQEERRRQTEVIGPISQMTRSEAEHKKLVFLSKLTINSSGYQIPSSETFGHGVKHYREIFAPRMLRASTFSIADGHIKNHLEADSFSWHLHPGYGAANCLL